MKVKYFNGFWTMNDAINNPNCLFIFGDNDIKKGRKGQAVIRDAKNSFGIPTKKKPFYDEDSYYTDDEYDDNIDKIFGEFIYLKLLILNNNYEFIYLPQNGLGTGLAKLPIKAPRTYQFLQEQIDELITKYP